MTFFFFLASLLSLSTGFVLVFLCWPTNRPILSDLLLKSFLSVGLGVGASSGIFFLCLYVGASLQRLALLDVLLLGFLLTILLLSIVKNKKPANGAPFDEIRSEPLWNSKMQWVPFLGFVLALGSSLVSFITLSVRNPNGSWDAWAVWNGRARFLFRAGDQWKDAFSNLLSWSRLDYPLLLPASVARLWKYAGNDSVAVPVLFAMVFTFGTVGLTVSSLAALRTRSQGFLAGIVLASTPFFVIHGASQYVDIPLSFYYLATIVLLCLQDRTPEDRFRLVTLAGMTAGFAAWTKNEGLLFLLSIVVARLAVIVCLRGWRTCLKQIVPFAIGLTPILIIIVFFKTSLAGPSYLSSPSGSLIHKLVDFHRYSQIFQAFGEEIFVFGDWVLVPAPLLAFYLLLLGIRFKNKNQAGILTALLAVCMTLMGYFLIYVIGPFDVQWWLSTSLNRLLVQLWPSLIFIFFLIVKSPEEALTERPRKYETSLTSSQV